MRLAKNALNLGAKKDKNKGSMKNSSINNDNYNVTKVVNDVELTFQLRRSMNNLPRISKKFRPYKS